MILLKECFNEHRLRDDSSGTAFLSIVCEPLRSHGILIAFSGQIPALFVHGVSVLSAIQMRQRECSHDRRRKS